MTNGQALEAIIFGLHTHVCPTAHCGGNHRVCSVRFDCQPGPQICSDCAYLQDELARERRAWRQLDRLSQTGVGV